MSLNFEELRAANKSRAERWHGPSTEPWSLADWSNAMCGEAGEAANVVKKIRRWQTSIGQSYNTPGEVELYSDLAEEIADLLIYADLLAMNANIDLGEAIRHKFNHVSVKQGFPERL